MRHITINDLVKEARRELGLRERIYPKWIEQERLDAETAYLRIALQRSIVKALERIAGSKSGPVALLRRSL